MAGKDYDEEFTWDDAIGGGLLTGYTAIIRNPEFGIEEDYRDDTVRFLADLEVTDNPDPDSEIELGHEFNEGWNVGNTNTWEESVDGQEVSRIDSKRSRLNENSGYGLLVGIASNKDGHKGYGDHDDSRLSNSNDLRKVLIKRQKEDGLTPFDASAWDGLEFVWERLKFSFKDDDGDKVDYERVYPVKFVGVAGESQPKPASADDNGEVDWDEVKKTVTEMAKEADTYSTWLASVIQEFPGINDSPLAASIMDSKSGLYAKANE